MACKYIFLFGCEMPNSVGLQSWKEPLIIIVVWINNNKMPYLISDLQTHAYLDRYNALGLFIMAFF